MRVAGGGWQAGWSALPLPSPPHRLNSAFSPETSVDARLVFCTCPDADTASRIARALVDERLAACVNAIAGVVSTYRWNAEVHVDDEVLLAIKTTADRIDAMQARLIALHPYAVPEVLAIEPAAGSAPYLAWIERETRPA
jgi:periplasmic divalent cation tolerance protein